MSSKRKSYTKKMTFPQISLDKALERLRLLSPEKRIYTNPELAKIFKNKSHTSGSYKEKTTALREFGLFTRTSPDIEISNLGKKILINRNVSLDDLQRAFFSCNMFKETYLHFLTEKNITPDKLANEAVKSYTVTPLMMDNFAHIFLKSAEHAGLAEKLVDGYTLLDSEYAHTLTTPRTSSFDTQTKKVPTTTTKKGKSESTFPELSLPGVRLHIENIDDGTTLSQRNANLRRLLDSAQILLLNQNRAK